MPTRKKQGNPWEKYPELTHMHGDARVQMERRRRHRAVRYGLYCLHNQETGGPKAKDLPKGFESYWLEQRPQYAVEPSSEGLRKTEVPDNKAFPIEILGGYAQFAVLWDVDEDLNVYLRHSSVWQEWNATLMRVVPIIGEH